MTIGYNSSKKNNNNKNKTGETDVKYNTYAAWESSPDPF